MTVQALLVRNPIARHRLLDEQVAAIDAIARAAGWQLGHVVTDRAGAATVVARDAVTRGVNVLIVHGGDGTVNETLNGLARSSTALAVLRGGTANVWAKEIGVPKDPVKAMRLIVGGERRRVDLGRASAFDHEPRYFLLMCGVGLDACIVENVGVRMKRRFGALAYIVAGVRTALGTKPWDAALTIDGETQSTPIFWLLAGNTRSYGGVVRLTHRATLQDGLLDVAIMHRGNALRLLRDGAMVLAARHERSPNIRYVRASAIEISSPSMPLQLDGEACGETPVRIDCVPAALEVIVPRGFRSPLFTRS